MLNLIQIIPNFGTDIAIIIRIITAVIFLLFVIPLQIKESKVKNGLSMLRRQMLISGVAVLSSNFVSLYFLFIQIPKGGYSIPSQFLQVINAATFLLIAVVGYKIYHQQYKMPHHKE